MRIIPLKEVKFSLQGFDCGVPPLNDYLIKYAGQNENLGLGRTYLLFSEETPVGYYTISTAQIECSHIPLLHRKRLPKYPIPAARLCRLAVHKDHQEKGYGSCLLMNSFERLWRASQEIALFGLLVDAKDEKASLFYKNFGFISCDHNSLMLFLPLKTIEQLITKR